MMLLPIMLAMPAPVAADPQAEITTAMTASAAGWSAGDMPRFLAIYADDAVFVTKDGLVRGKAAIAAR
jgi:ketosteroid isomerase-like protein